MTPAVKTFTINMNTLNQDAPAAVAEKSGDFTSSHWYEYNAQGWVPLYEPGKSFTLREARKLHAQGRIVVPSVTTIFGVMAKPQLDKWKQENVAKACWEMRNDAIYTNVEAWMDVAVANASGASKGAMDLGTRIHQAAEDYIAGREYDATLAPYVEAIAAKRAEMGITHSVTEQCMGSARWGYAGRCDDHSPQGMVVRDLKSRKSKGKKVPCYETDPLQLAAYGAARWGNTFFQSGKGEIWGLSTSDPGLITVHEFTGADLVPAFECFLSLVKVWQHISNFKPNAQ